MRGLFLAGLISLSMGCASREASIVGGGVDVLLDRSAPTQRRVRAAEGLDLSGVGHDAELAALHVVAWSDRHPVELRTIAIDRLRVYDRDAFWRAATRWLTSVDRMDVARVLADRAVRDGREEMLPIFVRRWSRPKSETAEESRPEHDAVAALGEERDAAATLKRLVDSPDTRVAFAAWAVLMRGQGEAELRDWLASQTATPSELVADLRAASAVLSRLPTDGEGLAWLSALRGNTELWSRWEQICAALPVEAFDGLELRHIAAVLRTDTAVREQGRESLRAWLAAALSGARQIGREIEPAALRNAAPPWGKMSWGDLVVALAVQNAMHNDEVRRAWFAQADRDRQDQTTEHGGVLTWDEQGNLVAHAFTPQRKEGDQKFFTPPRLVSAMYTGLAHYHFHAQSHRNTAYAGPGRGDLAFTRSLRANTLVLTFIDRDTLNVDLVLPDGIVMDLGCIARPADTESFN